MPRINKTQETLKAELLINRNYGKISKATGIDSKRLSQIKKGEKPTKSEVGKITSYGRKDKPVSLRTIARLSGFPEKSIQGRMRYRIGEKTSKSGKVTKFLKEQDVTVTSLSYHSDGTITGKRKNGTKVIYYVFIGEDLQKNEIIVGHGFRDYSYWLRKGKPDKVEETPTSPYTGEIYAKTTFYYAIMKYPDIAQYVQEHKYQKKR